MGLQSKFVEFNLPAVGLNGWQEDRQDEPGGDVLWHLGFICVSPSFVLSSDQLLEGI